MIICIQIENSLLQITPIFFSSINHELHKTLWHGIVTKAYDSILCGNLHA